VARGVGAAIVVFLATYGGLAIFAGAGAQPNAYIVLFTCFLAAVFSDEVWKWSRERLIERLAPTSDASTSDPAPVATAPAPAVPAPSSAAPSSAASGPAADSRNPAPG
jgi:hypothetical protein